ncbi:MAG: penicillin-binding protein 2 [Bifidobacteriaceae bacterium]|jgi:cell division protein FtsI (penicillin-binding protein 3)|nr:penicillin-binding protein 2 [Bifidobacteriaceae bacterium]
MLVLVMGLLVGFGARLVLIQAVDGPALAAQGQDLRMSTEIEPAQRGQIVTADGAVLASDVVRYEIQANPQVVGALTGSGEFRGLGPERLAAELAPLLGLVEDDLAAQLSDKSRTWVPLVKSATQDQWQPVTALVKHYWDEEKKDIGIYPVKHYERSYPAGTVAGNLVGYQYETEESAGQKLYTGLEQVLDEVLAGKAGQTKREIGGFGQPIPGGKVELDPAEPGCDVTLTLDSALQFEAQQAIQAQVEKYEASAGVVVVIEVKTGAILALADSDTPEPANPSGQTGNYANSRAIEHVFEPGSTGKVVTMAMLLEEGLATPSSQYTVPWQATFGGQLFKDSHSHAAENWTLAGILAQSSNIGTVMAGQAASDEIRYEYLKRFGFGQPTGIELAQNEAIGVVHQPGLYPARDGDPYWDGRTRNAVLFGQGVSVNALQATQVFATIGNAGQRLQPHLVKGVTCGDGEFQPTELADPVEVVSAETAAQVISMMEQVVESGTGKSGQVPGYRTAGKTGTSEMIEDGKTSYVGSFGGVVPAEDPQLAVGVFIVGPRSGGYYGSEVAGPVFQAIAAAAVDRAGVPPSTTPPSVLPLEW